MSDKTIPVKVQPKHVVQCPACGMGLVVLQMVDGTEIPCQPSPVVPLVPARPKIILSGPTPPQVAIRKLIEQTWEATYGAPVFIPHGFVCPRGIEGPAILLRSLEIPKEMQHEHPHEETDPGRDPDGGSPQERARGELVSILDGRPIDPVAE